MRPITHTKEYAILPAICWPGAFLHHQLLVATSGRRANPTPFRPAQTPQNPRPPKNSQPSSNPWSPGKIVGHHQGIVYNFQFQRLGDYHHIKSVSRPPLNFLDATMHLDSMASRVYPAKI